MDLRGGTKLELHDSVLESIEVLWEQRICRCTLRLVSPERSTVVLRFSGVTEVRIPHADPWGPSNNVMGLTETDHIYALAMQSGDSVSIVATTFEIEQPWLSNM